MRVTKAASRYLFYTLLKALTSFRVYVVLVLTVLPVGCITKMIMIQGPVLLSNTGDTWVVEAVVAGMCLFFGLGVGWEWWGESIKKSFQSFHKVLDERRAEASGTIRGIIVHGDKKGGMSVSEENEHGSE